MSEPASGGDESHWHIRTGAEPIAGFRLVERLGRGGFGEVWKADAPGGFRVALKFVRLGEDAGNVEQKSLEVIKDVRHPHLLTTFGAWLRDEYLILAMELADRTLLDRYRGAVGQGFPGIPTPEVFEYFLEAAKGIDFLNEPRHPSGGKESLGIQHRDIKPQNILLVGGSVKVGDFGLARVLEHSRGGPDNLLSGSRSDKRGSVRLGYRADRRPGPCLLRLRRPDNKLSGPPFHRALNNKDVRTTVPWTTRVSGLPCPDNKGVRTILRSDKGFVRSPRCAEVLGITTRRIFDREGHAHFVTFSCYRRRRLLDHDRAKQVILGVLGSQLVIQEGRCVGFVVMPDHVHAIVWFPASDQLSRFMKQWKQRSSVQLKRLLSDGLPNYAKTFDLSEPVWQARYYDFNLYSSHKIEEKLAYMHLNPVRAGLVQHPCDWPWSSARHYDSGLPVGVPVGWVD